MELTEALERIDAIHGHLARSESYRGYRPAALALSGTFDQLTDMTVFSMWIFYALGAGALFVLRRKMPDAPRPYRTIGYPIVPLVFLLAAVLLVVNTLVASPVESVTGLVLIALGLPLYFYYRKARVTE